MTRSNQRSPWSRVGRRLGSLGAVAVSSSMLMLVGCGAGPRNFENENDALRAERLELQREIDRVTENLKLREGEIATLRAELDSPGLDEGAQPPMISQLELGKFSGPVDENDDGRDEAIVIYLQTLDQHGRFLPIAATASIIVATLETQGQVGVVAEQEYTYQDFDAAYRSNLMGTHYTLSLPLPAEGELPEEVTLRVELTEATTGSKKSAQATYKLRQGS